MYFIASLVAAIAITIFLVSKIAKMLHAKRPEVNWVLLASFFGVFLAGLSWIALDMFIQGMKPIEMLAISLVIMLMVSSAAFKYINKMSWSGAVTTNIASIVIGLITVVTATVLNGESVQDTFNSASKVAKSNVNIVQSVATGNTAGLPEEEIIEDFVDDQEEATDDAEPMVTELDMLPAAAVMEQKAKKKRVYIEPKYHVISIRNINSVVGKAIKIHKKNGKVVTGMLTNLRGSDAVISQRFSGGTAITPVSLASIKKLEVYR